MAEIDSEELRRIVTVELGINTIAHPYLIDDDILQSMAIVESYAAKKAIAELTRLWPLKEGEMHHEIQERIEELQNEREGKSFHEHDWLLAAGDIRYRDTEGEYVIDLYVCECGAGGRVKTPKAMYDRGERVLGIKEES